MWGSGVTCHQTELFLKHFLLSICTEFGICCTNLYKNEMNKLAFRILSTYGGGDVVKCHQPPELILKYLLYEPVYNSGFVVQICTKLKEQIAISFESLGGLDSHGTTPDLILKNHVLRICRIFGIC